MRSGAATGIRLVELGPGRGTLMDDMIRVLFYPYTFYGIFMDMHQALSHFPASRSALKQVHLVENSLSMRRIQEAKLLKPSQEAGWDLIWHDSIDDIPRESGAYTMLVAHEFFDALPIHVLEVTATSLFSLINTTTYYPSQKSREGWREVLISSAPETIPINILADTNTSLTPAPVMRSNPRLRRVLSSSPTPLSILLGSSSPRFQTLPTGSRVEVSPISFKLARKVGEVLGGNSDGKSPGGCALIVDYGGEKSFGDSFRVRCHIYSTMTFTFTYVPFYQAFKDHKIVDVFHRPGECDLTANVDFAYLMEAVADIGMLTIFLLSSLKVTHGLPS
jgi:NADH dehydrogenase [ubiquinone] 1 alpha subcomplex assembly factor 7